MGQLPLFLLSKSHEPPPDVLVSAKEATWNYKMDHRWWWKVLIGFSGYVISPVWSSGLRILKQNRGEIRDWKYARQVEAKINP